MRDRVFYIWLQLALGICNRLTREIFERFEGIEEIYQCDDFSFLGEKRKKYIERLSDKETSYAFEVLKRCESVNASIIGYYDEIYPDSLRTIEAPPAAIYCIGELKKLDSIPCVGMVGTRKMSDYGKEVTEKFAYTFAKSGACIISGLAKGIDTAAHRGAVMADGYTVAVLGNPIGDVYPKENIKAFETLYKCGAVISEMYPACPRTKADFPNRNRIISGLSDAVIVTEAGEGSGALITARHAINQGKPVFAVPGTIGSENAGTNSLIKQGAPIATEPYDVLAVLSLEYPESLHPYEPSVTQSLRSYGMTISETKTAKKRVEIEEKEPVKIENSEKTDELTDFADDAVKGSSSDKILSVLDTAKPISADEISQRTGLPITEVLSELTLMEIYGDVNVSAGGRYTKF